ncbi:kinase-like domain-containing protein [Fomitopsis serialis]|uniref:kinase-like domain-containing protein n=1 Tax=Fomitopsis serialis TaxID=139415 RepID=UPI0020087878|nr:kinase-like domain-containing protein [Neoantrodia serialis]KAH9916190.1 kinase-like domain-containing protein [Neoantrodia serialis]
MQNLSPLIIEGLEARHPNVVLYLGLSQAPDGRIFIISEFIDNGNLRLYIHDKTKPFPWRLRISFATDIARALAYLHARKCIHRDLKGENLLVTANGRLKITDFGFARIAARNAEESKRLTFCGTDSYMSPEILTGTEFDLPTDIFSLGVIFCEIAARRLADDNTFRRTPPLFEIDPDELRHLASPGCPPAFLQLALDCLAQDPALRPNTRMIMDKLREIEAEVLSRPSEADDMHLGTVKFMTGGQRRAGAAPRIPSFGMGVGKDIRSSSTLEVHSSDESADSDEEYAQTIETLSHVDLNSVWGDTVAGRGDSGQPLLDGTSSTHSDYSTTVIKSHAPSTESSAPSLSSIMTIRPPTTADPAPIGAEAPTPAESLLSIESYYTASSSSISAAVATEGGSTIRSSSLPLVHRFSLLKPGAKRTGAAEARSRSGSPTPADALWSRNPLEFIFSSTLLAAKCDICGKRLGWKPVLECDDCGLRAHVKCGENAPMDCGIRPPHLGAHNNGAPSTPPSPAGKPKTNGKTSSPK